MLSGVSHAIIWEEKPQGPQGSTADSNVTETRHDKQTASPSRSSKQVGGAGRDAHTRCGSPSGSRLMNVPNVRSEIRNLQGPLGLGSKPPGTGWHRQANIQHWSYNTHTESPCLSTNYNTSRCTARGATPLGRTQKQYTQTEPLSVLPETYGINGQPYRDQ